MAAGKVLVYPHPLLKQVAPPAEPRSPSTELIAQQLIETMRSFPGCVGIAAPQIGELTRVAIVDCSNHPKAEHSQGLIVLINPKIVASSGSEIAREGCLSIPDLTANVRRATEITVAHGHGTLQSDGFEARCIQHEVDHLDGILFLDRVASLSEDVFERKRRS